MHDRQRRGLAFWLLEVGVDADLPKPVLRLSAARLHVEDRGLDVDDAEPHSARAVITLDRTPVDEHLLPQGGRPLRRPGMGPRPLEDLPDVRLPVGFDARVEDWIVEDETFDDGASLVERAQRDRHFHALRGQDLFVPVEEPHAMKVGRATGDRQILPLGRHRQPVPRPQIG